MNQMYLHKEDLQSMLKFLESFPDKDTIFVTADNSSGIGTITKASIIGVVVNGQIVTVTKDIVDESSW
jgi:hypothetical protein